MLFQIRSRLMELCVYWHISIRRNSAIVPWTLPYRHLGLADRRQAHSIRNVRCLDGQMVNVGTGAPGQTLLLIAGWIALGYEALLRWVPMKTIELVDYPCHEYTLNVKYIHIHSYVPVETYTNRFLYIPHGLNEEYITNSTPDPNGPAMGYSD